MSETSPYLDANRALWDEWTAIHERSDFYGVDAFVAGDPDPTDRGRPAGVRLRPYEIDEVGDVSGRDLLHLQCHFGMDTLSWARLGARVTGADFSERAIELAQRLAQRTGLDARFVRSNLYDLPANLDGDFDVVYTSRGVLGWLPDIRGWARVAAHFVRPGGFFYVTEIHPVIQAFDDEDATTDLRLRYHYWHRDAPLVFPVQGSYADRDAQVSQPFEYGWAHGLGEIVTALADAGLRIEFLHEFPFVEWPVPYLDRHDDGTWRLRPDQRGPEGDGEIPLFFSLRASKP